jgi:hypothetical protein
VGNLRTLPAELALAVRGADEAQAIGAIRDVAIQSGREEIGVGRSSLRGRLLALLEEDDGADVLAGVPGRLVLGTLTRDGVDQLARAIVAGRPA